MADVKKIIKGVVDLPSHLKEAVESAHAPKVFYSTAGRLADKISEANPKMSEYEVMRRAFDQSTKKLDWERVDKPALEKTYGDLGGSTFTDSKVKRMRNTPAVVEERKRAANEFLDQPTEPWVPPKPELQAFDRSSIKDALEGFPDVPQSVFPRDIPPRASTKHVDELYTDPANRELIKKQIMRGLPLGGESFYASLYPVKQAVLEAGMPASKFDSWVHSMAPASARNSIMNEMAVGQFLRNLHSQGIPLTPENVKREMAAFKEQFGIGLPLFDGHRLGVANVLENNLNLRDLSQANIPTNYKIPTYGAQKTGDFAHSATLDVHEAAGQTQGSRSHPYFTEAGGFGNTEYNAGEQGFLGIAKELGLPGGMAQAGRWFGGGELTGLKSPRGDALDLLEKQFAFSLLHQGRQPNPANIRSEVLKQIETGEGMLLPWYRKEGMPDVRTTGLQRKDGGQVEHMQAGGIKKAIGALGELAQAAPKKVTHGMLRRHGMEIGNKEEADALYSSGHRIFGMHELDEVPFEITDRKMFDSYAPDMMLAYPPEKPLLKADGGGVEHMQAGGLKTLMGEVLNRGGTYAARRLQRAADEIPNLEKLFQEQALQRVFLGDNARALMTIKPSDFEKYAAPIGDLRPESSSNIVDLIGIKNQGGYKDVPFLEVNKKLQGSTGLPFISGHEGRHRNRAMDQSGEQASLVQFLPRSELREPFERRYQDQYIDAIRKEMALTGNKVMPEKYYESVKDPSGRIVETRDIQRPAIDLPDLYAEGGVVHKQAGGMMGLVNEFKALQAAHNAARLAKTTRTIPPVQDMVISQAEKEANLARYLENAAVKDRMYHATGDDFSVVDVDKSNPRSKFGTGFYMTPNTNYANFFGNLRSKEGKPSQVMPVYSSVQNPYEISGTQNIPFNGIDREKLKALGYDGVLFRNDAGKVQEVVAFDPTQVKSAIGNRGTYDPTEVEMTKAEGGAVHSQAEDGDIMRQLFDHALDKGDIHEMTHAMLVKQHEAEYG